jgi:Xaa-Pro aminopeptidase
MNKLVHVVIVCLSFTSAAYAEDVERYKARRQAVMEAMDGGVAVIYGAGGSSDIVRSGYIQESNFYYLTGVSEPGAALILAPGDHRYNEILYLQRRDVEDEDWNGRREPLGIE